LAFSLPIFLNLVKIYPERGARIRSFSVRLVKRKKDKVIDEKSVREKDLGKGLNAYRNKFRVPDTKTRGRAFRN
jgi:hypothetical protein